MGNVNFYLKAPEPGTGLSSIFLQFKYSGIRFKYYFGQSINPGKKLRNGDFENWSAKRQRVKSNRETTADGQHSLNDLLDNLEAVLLATYRKELANGIPAKSKLKEALDNFRYQNQENPDRPTLYSLADRFISGEIKNKEGENKSTYTLKTYNTVLNHLKKFEKEKKYPVDFNTINLEFYRKYINYLGEKKLSQNTRAKHVQVVKVWMNEALDLRYTTNAEFKHKKFTASWQETDAVYLTDDDILNLWEHDLSGNKKLERVRDLFVFGCYVGLRYSDYSTVKPENIVKHGADYFIKILTAKTRQLVIIPANPIVLEIFAKYKENPNRLPKSVSNQKFNEWVKDACKEAGLHEQGRLATAPELELWQCVSSHTARRSFATNLYLQGFPVIDLMRITGHSTEKSFMKYIRHSKLDAARRLMEHMTKVWSNKLLKVA